MTIQVIKGQKVDVTKNRPDIKNLVVNINWQVKDKSKASLYEIHSADAKGQNFGQIENVTVAICDKDTQEVLLRYDPNAKILKGIQMKLVKRDFSNMMFIKRGSGTNGATREFAERRVNLGFLHYAKKRSIANYLFKVVLRHSFCFCSRLRRKVSYFLICLKKG